MSHIGNGGDDELRKAAKLERQLFFEQKRNSELEQHIHELKSQVEHLTQAASKAQEKEFELLRMKAELARGASDLENGRRGSRPASQLGGSPVTATTEAQSKVSETNNRGSGSWLRAGSSRDLKDVDKKNILDNKRRSIVEASNSKSTVPESPTSPQVDAIKSSTRSVSLLNFLLYFHHCICHQSMPDFFCKYFA